MKLAMIGLGRMGGNMTRRLRKHGIDVVGYDTSPAAVGALADETGMTAADSLTAVVTALPPPRIVWLMLPAGAVTSSYVSELSDMLDAGDLVVDGANSNYHDSIAHADRLGEKHIAFADVGVSGGVYGLESGYSLMIGGTTDAVRRLEPVLRALAPAPDLGWVHCGRVGAGHYAKMIHNGIEYGMMQALAEGFALLEARRDLGFDLAAVAESWRHGSVVRSWLLDLVADVLAEGRTLDSIAPHVADSGEGRWTAIEAIERGVPTPVISSALMMRFASQGRHDFASRLLAVLRNRFGGHAVKQASR